jgi:hypothetical protein
VGKNLKLILQLSKSGCDVSVANLFPALSIVEHRFCRSLIREVLHLSPSPTIWVWLHKHCSTLSAGIVEPPRAAQATLQSLDDARSGLRPAPQSDPCCRSNTEPRYRPQWNENRNLTSKLSSFCQSCPNRLITTYVAIQFSQALSTCTMADEVACARIAAAYMCRF